jgi:release factor glutamine methyltransferase
MKPAGSPRSTMPPETAGAAIRSAAARLAETSETARLDAELLMAHALGIGREAMLLGGLDRSAPEGFAALVERRAGGEPLAYITGHRAFWTIELAVAPGVLIPRPDSETLIEAAAEHFRGGPSPRRVLDLGTGSGALLLAALAEWPEAAGVGIDRSPAALAIARANAEALGFAGRAEMIEGGWADAAGKFDLILCNPPYIGTGEVLPRDVIDHEPHSALFAGADGLDDYRAIVPLLPRFLADGGVGCIEIGATQGEAVTALTAMQGLRAHIRTDLAGRDRCVVVMR